MNGIPIGLGAAFVAGTSFLLGWPLSRIELALYDRFPLALGEHLSYREIMIWLLLILILSGCLAVVLSAFRRWQAHWGASRQEVARGMPGDEWVPTPDFETTRAVTVRARPEDIYPWLVQMGWKRGGLYSYDWLDRLLGILDHDSVPRVLPELQKLEAGDLIPLKKGSPFPVRALEKDSYLVLAGDEAGIRWTWQMGLYPLPKDACRFVSRNRVRVPMGVLTRWKMVWLDLGAFIMVRKWLLNIRGLAEKLAEERRAKSGSASRNSYLRTDS